MAMHVDHSVFDVAGQSRLAQASKTGMELAIAQRLDQSRKDSRQRFIQGSPPKGVKRRRGDLDVRDGDDELEGDKRASTPVNGKSLMDEFTLLQHSSTQQASTSLQEEESTPDLNKSICIGRPVKRLRTRRRTVAHSKRIVRSRSSYYIARPVTDETYNRVLSLKAYAMDMVEVQDDVTIGVGVDAPAGHKFTHLVRIVPVDDSESVESKAGSMRTWYSEDDSLRKGVVRLDLYVSRTDVEKGEGTSQDEGKKTFKLNPNQIYAARDFLSLCLPCPIRPESPGSYQDPLHTSPYTAHTNSALLNRAHNASVLIFGEEGLEGEVVGVYACFAAYASERLGMEEALGGVYYTVAAEEGKERWEKSTMELWEGDVRAVGMLQAVAGRAGRPQDV